MKAQNDMQALLEQWRDAPLEQTSGDATLDHDTQIRSVARALGRVAERKARRRWQRKQWLSVAFAAGVFGLAAAGWQLAHERTGARPVAVVHVQGTSPGEAWLRAGDGARRAIADALAAGEGLETGESAAELGFPSGAKAQLAQHSQVEVIRAAGSEAFRLSAGAVEVEVPKLGAGQFAVQTPDALVVVHGTHFSVSIEPGPGTAHTRVDVSRGLVSVESQGEQVWLSAGQHWPAEVHAVPPAAQSAAVSSPEPPSSEPPTINGGTRAAESAGSADAPRAPDASDVAGSEPQTRKSTPASAALRKQNRSFARAMNLKKRDEPAAALAELERLARRYPHSVLRQEIRVEHFRLLTRLGRAREAAREARAYLGDYPHGYARQEARELALGAE